MKWIAAILVFNAQPAEIVEALGFRWAVTMAKEKGGEKFSFEGDAQCVIQMLQGERVANSILAVIIGDSIRLSSSFCKVSFSFVSRDCNRVAHAVAKYALFIELSTTWDENFPDWVCREALFDVSS